MPDMILRPKAQNEKGRRIFIISMIAFATTFAASLLLPKYSGIVQLVSLVFLCISLYFYTRYVASVYSYEVTSDSDGATVFIVRQTAGKRSTTHCRMTLSSLVRAEQLNADEMKLYRKNRRTKAKHTEQDAAPEHLWPDADVSFYDYCVTYSPDTATLLCFRSYSERADLLVELSEEFRALLIDTVARERELAAQDEA